ncbi:MAG: hypothetical protein KKF48_05610 [Nanoarchaeota archaeon]|nr:hypothetical protein [Nanoarchaeota archaeon]MBU1028494.1 hypothetical protein [Nanoarchaeota archaeon]
MDKQLLGFIAKAKKQAYASTSAKPKKTKDGGKTYTIKQGDYVYTDTYFGNLIDCGQERVYFKGKVIWAMAYRGGMCRGKEHMDNVAFDFLKGCISKMPKEFPARGPKVVKKGDWKYENKWKGDIRGFIGEENIYYKGEKVCFRNYVGGLIKNKK